MHQVMNMTVAESDYKLLKKLQAIEFDIFKECIRICEKHHLRYFLLGGSALGAVRHSGFIPWDDDIDVGMPRPDYKKFLSVAQKELGTFLFLQTHETDPSYPQHFAKIRNSNTTFIQQNVSHLIMNHGVYIDVFPLDGFPSNKFFRKIYIFLFKLYRASIMDKLGVKNNIFSIRFLIRFYSVLFSLPCLRKKIENIMIKNDYDKSGVIINWCGSWGLKEAVPKDFLGKGSRMEFNGLTVTIPYNYDGYLKSLYGDYMTPPPIGKRISHHFTDVIDLENSYKKPKGKYL